MLAKNVLKRQIQIIFIARSAICFRNIRNVGMLRCVSIWCFHFSNTSLKLHILLKYLNKTRFKTSLENKQRQKVLSTKLSTRNVFTNIYGFIAKE